MPPCCERYGFDIRLLLPPFSLRVLMPRFSAMPRCLPAAADAGDA